MTESSTSDDRRPGGEMAPVELLPPRQAWGRRWIFLGVVFVMIAGACANIRNPERFFADRMLATGDVHVLDTSDVEPMAAFARALSSPPEDAHMTLVKSDWQSRTYQVLLSAPSRDAALAQLEALLGRFRSEFTKGSGRNTDAFADRWVVPVPTPAVQAWARRIKYVLRGLVGAGAASVALGAWMLWTSVKGDRRKFAELVFDTDDPPGDGAP
jgi:hypothetical protein